MGNRKLKFKWFVAGAIIFVVAFMTISISFVVQTRQTLNEEKINYLKEISLKSANSVENQVDGMLSTIEGIATFIGYQKLPIDEALAILKEESKANNFKRMGIVDSLGISHTTDGVVIDFGEREYYNQALAGKSFVSDCIVDEIGGDEEINVVATPIYNDKEIVAVLFGVQTQEIFSKNIQIESFDGKGYSYIINSKGDEIIRTLHPDSVQGYSNIFESMLAGGMDKNTVNQIKEDCAQGKDGTIEYERNGIRRHLCYTKTTIQDWCILTTVPAKEISAKSDNLIVQLGLMTAATVGVVIGVCIFVLNMSSENNKKLSSIAYTDRVTGYSNWQKFEIDAHEILMQNQDTHYAMVITDINKFKIINDVFGHEVGNNVLKHFANILKAEVGHGETFARSSADNFNILMYFENEEKLAKRLENIAAKVQNFINGYIIDLAMGVYPVPDNSLAINILSDRATISKILAKKNNTLYRFFKDENRLEILNEKEIENSMDKALENREFVVYLQPKILVSSANTACPDGEHCGSIVGAEALTRWNKANVGLLSPITFVPLFEKNGFICKMDLYVFEEVCKTLRRIIDSKKYKVVPISVNISRVHLSNINLPQILYEITQKYGVDTSLLEIELTESAVYSDVEGMIATMKTIKDYGFKLAIDDFGSGYSSLSALKDLPADVVKLDKSFLDQAEHDVRGEKILEGIVSLSKGLGLSTVAEGVETAKQMEFLKRVGCEIAQGYWFSRPISIPEYEKLVLL